MQALRLQTKCKVHTLRAARLRELRYFSVTQARVYSLPANKPTSIQTQLQFDSELPYSFIESTRPALEHIPVVKLLSANVGGGSVKLEIDGEQSSLGALYLRDSCSCRACVNFDSGQKKFQTADISPSIRVRKVSQLEDGSLLLRWENDLAHFGEDHVTRLFPAELIERTPIPPEPLPSIWNRSDMVTRFRKVDYQSFMRDEVVQLDALTELVRYGLLFLKNLPKEDTSVEQIAERIGVLRETFYGRTWDVKDKPQAENIAYTAGHLGLHMDLLYMRYPPGFQILHCMQSAGQGGDSMFIDALDAAKIVDEKNSALFDALQEYPVTWHYVKDTSYYRDTKVTFEMKNSWHKALLDFVNRQKLSRAYLISAVNWSPQFQAPFGIHTSSEDSLRKLRQYHEAAREFAQILDDENQQFRYKMRSDECVVFNNRRVMHGRTEFRSNPGELRLLKGAYVDADDILSRFTHLSRKLSLKH